MRVVTDLELPVKLGTLWTLHTQSSEAVGKGWYTQVEVDTGLLVSPDAQSVLLTVQRA